MENITSNVIVYRWQYLCAWSSDTSFSICSFTLVGGKLLWEKVVLLLFMKWKPAVITCQCTLSKTSWPNFCQKGPAKYRFVFCIDINTVCCRAKNNNNDKKNDSELERADLHDQEWRGWSVSKDKLLRGKLLSSLAFCRNILVILLMFLSIGRWLLPLLMTDIKTSRNEICQQLSYYGNESEEFLHSIMTTVETRAHCYDDQSIVISLWNIIIKLHL